MKVFPECIERLDIRYASKNVYKKVIELGKVHKELVGFGQKVKRRFQTLAYEAKEDIEVFSKGLDIAILHWCDDHSKCNHQGEKQGKKYQPLKKDGARVQAL